MRRLIALMVAGCTVAWTGVQPASASLPANYSMMFLMPEAAAAGTFMHGVWNEDSTFAPPISFTGAAASRDSAVIVDRTSGQAYFYTFTNGTAAFKQVTVSDSPIDGVAASCDSALLYNKTSGRAVVGTLSNGTFTLTKLYRLPTGFTAVDASCDTVSLTKPNGQGITGLLKGGAFVQKAHVSELPNAVIIHTATSFLRYSPKTGKLQWGTSKLGIEHPTGSRSTGSTTLRTGGSSDSVIIYQSSTGTGYFSTLVNGKLTAVGALSGFSSGWQIIAGGK